eukprot:COSAG05_NODE_1276_length_5305_cov_7.675759_4_plen_49_part_00
MEIWQRNYVAQFNKVIGGVFLIQVLYYHSLNLSSMPHANLWGIQDGTI